MAIKDLFRNQFSKVIEWKDQQSDLLVWKFPSSNDEIKNASKLIIAPGQGAILVYEGEVSDQIEEDGIYNMETDNHPFITNLLKLRQLFESEHKLRVYFYRTSENVNLNWGTSQAIKYMDPVYNIPVQLGANGTFSFKIAKALYLFTEVIGSKDFYTVQAARDLLQNRFPQSLSSVLAQNGVSYINIDAQLPILSEKLKK